jgi:hypothetical protein
MALKSKSSIKDWRSVRDIGQITLEFEINLRA